MDNASFHQPAQIEQMCRDAGVKLVYLPPYSPDLNQVEEFFAQLKALIKRRFRTYEEKPGQDFQTFLEQCVDTVGNDKESAKGHFRHAGISVEELKISTNDASDMY